jgi:hypothetical protein
MNPAGIGIVRQNMKSLLILLTTLVCLQAFSQPQPLDAYEQNRRLGRGVNIIGYDPIWRSRDQARFQEKHFRQLKEAGFQSVRINLHSFRHMETLDKRAHNPFLVASGLANRPVPMPWFGHKELVIAFA